MYFNVDHVRDAIHRLRGTAADSPQLVVLDLSAAPYVDIQSAHALAELADELAARGVQVQAVEARARFATDFAAKASTPDSAASPAATPSTKPWPSIKTRPSGS